MMGISHKKQLRNNKDYIAKDKDQENQRGIIFTISIPNCLKKLSSPTSPNTSGSAGNANRCLLWLLVSCVMQILRKYMNRKNTLIHLICPNHPLTTYMANGANTQC